MRSVECSGVPRVLWRPSSTLVSHEYSGVPRVLWCPSLTLVSSLAGWSASSCFGYSCAMRSTTPHARCPSASTPVLYARTLIKPSSTATAKRRNPRARELSRRSGGGRVGFGAAQRWGALLSGHSGTVSPCRLSRDAYAAPGVLTAHAETKLTAQVCTLAWPVGAHAAGGGAQRSSRAVDGQC